MTSLVILQKTLMTAAIRTLMRRYTRTIVDTDAYNKVIVCISMLEQLIQLLKPIEYWSRPLTQAEPAYGTTKQDCLAVVRTLLPLRPNF